MNQTQMSARVGLFFLIGIALIWLTSEALQNGGVDKKHGYTVVAGFTTLKELKAGDEVRMAGVRIGVVDSTRLAHDRAEAVLRIQPDQKVARDAVATISMAGLIGTNYVSFTIGHPEAGTLKPGDEVTTKDAADLNQIMSDLGSLGQDVRTALKSISGGADGQGGLFQKLDRLVGENSAKLTASIDNLEDITAKIRNGQGTIGKLVNDPTAYDRMLAMVNEIKGAATDARTLLANTQTLLDQVKTGKGTLGTLIYDEEAGKNLKIGRAHV